MAVGKNPLNYSTSIAASKSANECVERLRVHGATQIGMTYDQGRPTGIAFAIKTAHGPRQFSLPVNTAGTLRALQKAYKEGRIAPRYARQDQAERVAWRVLKDWLEAQLALIEAGLASLDEVLLPYMQIGGGRTLYQAFADTGSLAIESA